MVDVEFRPGLRHDVEIGPSLTNEPPQSLAEIYRRVQETYHQSHHKILHPGKPEELGVRQRFLRAIIGTPKRKEVQV